LIALRGEVVPWVASDQGTVVVSEVERYGWVSASKSCSLFLDHRATSGGATMNKRIVGLTLALVLVGAAVSFAPSAAAEGSLVQSATGSGNFVTSSGFFRTFAFSVLKYSDGSVQGEAEVKNPVVGTLRHFQVDCLSVRAGNLAIVSGIVTSAEDPSLVGAPAIFAAQDNGEGAGSIPD
jgi:hypothetical protein